jgi:hypothetical protein
MTIAFIGTIPLSGLQVVLSQTLIRHLHPERIWNVRIVPEQPLQVGKHSFLNRLG